MESDKFCHFKLRSTHGWFNRYRRKRPKVDGIFDSALSHTRRSDAAEKKRRK